MVQHYVSCEPDVKSHTLGPEDEFLIVACDGIWDVLSSQQAVDIVGYFFVSVLVLIQIVRSWML